MRAAATGLVALTGVLATTIALATPALAAGTLAATSRVGDRDNFGFGAKSGAPPCVFFDNRTAGDPSAFDHALMDPDETNSWTHTFAPVADATRVKLTVWEEFSDNSDATITIDGTTVPLVKATADAVDVPVTEVRGRSLRPASRGSSRSGRAGRKRGDHLPLERRHDRAGPRRAAGLHRLTCSSGLLAPPGLPTRSVPSGPGRWSRPGR